MRIFAFSLACTTMLVVGNAAQAQIALTLDIGNRSELHENGHSVNAVYGGIGASATLTGTTRENWALVLPVGAEARFGSAGQIEMNSTVDVALRTRNVVVGGGLGLLFPASASEVPDEQLSGGEAFLFDNQMFGLSGLMRVNLGRGLFVQGRYTAYTPEGEILLMDSCNSEFLDSSGQATCRELREQSRPDFEGASEFKAGIGYTFLSESPVVLRVLYTRQQYEYENEDDNQFGAYDRTSQSVTAGVAFVFQ